MSMLCGMFACNDRGPSAATQPTAPECPSLPDPIVQRLGRVRARELHIAGVRQHILDVRRTLGSYVDVCSQCDAAEALIDDPLAALSQRPLILCAGSMEGENAQLHISGINTRRETNAVVFTFSMHDLHYRVVYLRGIVAKDEEMVLALPAIGLRFVSSEEVNALMTEAAGGLRTLIVQSEKEGDGNPDIPLPVDIPVYVSVCDRSGLKSDVAPFHRNLFRSNSR